MPTSKRERWGDELEFEDIALHREGNELTGGMALPSRENWQPKFPDKDYDGIAKDLNTTRDKVSYVVHEEQVYANARSTKPRAKFTLAGTAGDGEGYDPELDPKMAPQLNAMRLAKAMAQLK